MGPETRSETNGATAHVMAFRRSGTPDRAANRLLDQASKSPLPVVTRLRTTRVATAAGEVTADQSSLGEDPDQDTRYDDSGTRSEPRQTARDVSTIRYERG